MPVTSISWSCWFSFVQCHVCSHLHSGPDSFPFGTSYVPAGPLRPGFGRNQDLNLSMCTQHFNVMLANPIVTWALCTAMESEILLSSLGSHLIR